MSSAHCHPCVRYVHRERAEVRVFKGCQDGGNDTFSVLQHVVIPKADHAKSMSAHGRGPDAVMIDGLSMLPAVNFNDETTLKAAEVGDVAGYRILPAKLESGQSPVSQMLP